MFAAAEAQLTIVSEHLFPLCGCGQLQAGFLGGNVGEHPRQSLDTQRIPKRGVAISSKAAKRSGQSERS
jgi:hypothetical protein